MGKMQNVVIQGLDLLKLLDVQRGRHKDDKVSGKQELVGVAVFSFLFFMWGLAYGLLDIMNYHIKVAMGIDRTTAAQLALAYYLAYIPGTLLIGGPMVEKLGYRMGAIVGLVVLALGDEVMSVGAEKLSFNLMAFSSVLVGLGVSTLERTANAYVVNLGPRRRAAVRILVAQTMAGVGTVIAPLLANKVIFDPTESDTKPGKDLADPRKCVMPAATTAGESAGALDTVVVFYRFLGAGIVGLAAVFALVFFRTKWVVEVEVASSPKLDHPKWQLWKHPLLSLKFGRLWYGVVANFINLGCQVTVAQFFIEHMRVNACANDKDAANDMLFAQVAFVVGRLAAAGFVLLSESVRSKVIKAIFKPRTVLCAFVAGAVAFTGVGIEATGTTAIVAACMVMFAEAPSFPMIFESATAGFDEKWTPTAETIIILSISGGGLQPLLMGILVEKVGISDGWVLTTACFGLVFSYTLMCNVVPSWSKALDAAHTGGSVDTDAEKAGPSATDSE